MPTAYLPPSRLRELADVSSAVPGAPQDGNPLIWNDASGFWEAGAVPKVNGLRFPSAVVSNADPNTLDDYEEGVFNPVFADTQELSGDYALDGYTHDASTGGYIKIGRLCTYSGFIGISAKPDRGSGRWIWITTPFLADPLVSIHTKPNVLSSYNGSWSIGSIEPQTNVNYAVLTKATAFNTGTSVVTLADLDVGVRIAFSFSYQVA